MSSDQWLDRYYYAFSRSQTWPIHEKVMNIQSAVLTMLLNPTIITHIYDNEYLMVKGEDHFALSELVKNIHASVWTELEQVKNQTYNSIDPLISSLRRNLQRLYTERLIKLSLPSTWYGASSRPLANLAKMHLRNLTEKIDSVQAKPVVKLDDYSLSHLVEVKELISKAFNSTMIYNQGRY